MRTLPLLLAALLPFLPSCSSTGGTNPMGDLFIAYTGTGVEIQNMAITAKPGEEAITATGVGYDLTRKTAYVTYADGHKVTLAIKGAGFGGGLVALVLADGSKVTVNVKTGVVATQGSQFTNPQP